MLKKVSELKWGKEPSWVKGNRLGSLPREQADEVQQPTGKRLVFDLHFWREGAAPVCLFDVANEDGVTEYHHQKPAQVCPYHKLVNPESYRKPHSVAASQTYAYCQAYGAGHLRVASTRELEHYCTQAGYTACPTYSWVRIHKQQDLERQSEDHESEAW
ncbi:MAG: hypothetical protein AB1898_10070 [Acidobacteriota bacterium]